MHQGCFAAQLAEEEADERRRRCRRRQRARPSVAEKEGAEAEEEAAWRQTTDHTEALHRGPCTARKGERAHMLGIYGSRQALPSAFSESPWNQSWVGLGHTFWLDCARISTQAEWPRFDSVSVSPHVDLAPAARLARTAARTHISTHNPLDDLVAKSRCRTGEVRVRPLALRPRSH